MVSDLLAALDQIIPLLDRIVENTTFDRPENRRDPPFTTQIGPNCNIHPCLCDRLHVFCPPPS